MEESEQKISTWNADGKKSGSLGKEKYEVVKDFIVSLVKKKREVTFPSLLDEAKCALASHEIHEDETSFLVVKVKGDLEARGILRKHWTVGRQQVIRMRRKITS